VSNRGETLVGGATSSRGLEPRSELLKRCRIERFLDIREQLPFLEQHVRSKACTDRPRTLDVRLAASELKLARRVHPDSDDLPSTRSPSCRASAESESTGSRRLFEREVPHLVLKDEVHEQHQRGALGRLTGPSQCQRDHKRVMVVA